MRKLIAQQYTSLDGVGAELNGDMKFIGRYGEPAEDMYDPSFVKSSEDFLNEIDTMIIGATTYKMFAGYWPADTSEFGKRLNSLNKVVASTSLTAAPWGDWSAATVTDDPVATINQLKQQPGKDIVLWGSMQLMHNLEAAGVINEYYLRICPSAQPNGTRIFSQPHMFELIEAKVHDKGMITARYIKSEG